MYRKIFKAENEDDLTINLPIEYLNKQVEVIAFKINEDVSEPVNRKADLDEAIRFFDTIRADMSNYKFNRDEANER